jgi:non-homologous end joining protein Ku|tara:strand:+ start:262 stop:450 length:189 start_codon:yes stop_codon:yes gene_type:complete
LEVTDYQTIKSRVQRFNKEVEVRKYAGELIKQLSEGEDEVSFKDAYTMAYLEIVQPKLDYHM